MRVRVRESVSLLNWETDQGAHKIKIQALERPV